MSDSTTGAAVKAPWQDRTAQVTFLLAVALNLLLFILVLLAREPLEQGITTAGGDRFGTPVGDPYSALILPIIGLIAWLAGGLLGYFYYKVRDEAPVAYIVWGAVVVIELATWAPAISLIINI